MKSSYDIQTEINELKIKMKEIPYRPDLLEAYRKLVKDLEQAQMEGR